MMSEEAPISRLLESLLLPTAVLRTALRMDEVGWGADADDDDDDDEPPTWFNKPSRNEFCSSSLALPCERKHTKDRHNTYT